MGKIIAFSVYQYAYAGKEVNKNFVELIRYMKNNHIVLCSGQMLISGRVCETLKIGDVLVTSKGTLVEIKGFHVYGIKFDYMSAGMTCALFTNSMNEELIENQSLYFVKNKADNRNCV